MRDAGSRPGAVSTRRRQAPPVDLALRAERRARLRRAGRAGSVLLLVAAVVGGAGYGIYVLTAPETFPLQAVRFDSELERVREEDLRKALDPHLHGGFWGLDVDRIRLALQQLAWVEVASVRRLWPGLLQVSIHEQEAVAVWNDVALVNPVGETFTPPRDTWPQGLPALTGPASQAGAVSRRLQGLRPAFAELGLGIEALAMDARESWTVTLEGGATIALGREDIDDRIARFTGAYTRLRPEAGRQLGSVDLRYPNGFAIRWTVASGDTE